jgi:hypothetical protein
MLQAGPGRCCFEGGDGMSPENVDTIRGSCKRNIQTFLPRAMGERPFFV